MAQSTLVHHSRKRAATSQKVFEATAVVKFTVELTRSLEEAVESARYFLEEELGFDSARVFCVEKRPKRKQLRDQVAPGNVVVLSGHRA